MQAHLVDHEDLARAPLLDRVGLLPHAIDQLRRALLVRVRVRISVRVRIMVRVRARVRVRVGVRARARVRVRLRVWVAPTRSPYP